MMMRKHDFSAAGRVENIGLDWRQANFLCSRRE